MEITTRSVDAVMILELNGQFESDEGRPVVEWLEQAASTPPARIVINLESVSFIDSIGLAALVRNMKRCREVEGDVHLCNLQKRVYRTFRLTRLDRAFRIFDNEADAVRAFAESSSQEDLIGADEG
ncbi:MAG: STAS domain-containing protein [Chloroflexaceae bacterium]|nr:STAS domain-containing protein [Chloroflexaceae bacterium]